MISVADARDRILASLSPLPAETVSIAEAWNRVLASPVIARFTQPPADVSAMDGYAASSVDAVEGAVLQVIGEARAGHPFADRISQGQTVRVFTGSVVPEGADCVVLQEDAVLQGNCVALNQAGELGRHIRRRGQDFASGQTLLLAGQRLAARHIGLAAAANHPWLTVHRQPRVAILATGDELVLPGEPLRPGGIIGSNGLMLGAIIRAACCVPVYLRIAGDSEDDVANLVSQAYGSDLLVTIGGASVGDYDLVQAGLAAHGFELDFWKIAMRPGKPMIYGRLGKVPVLGLPGNPVSAAVCAALFLVPALNRLLGVIDAAPHVGMAITSVALRANDMREDYLRASIHSRPDGTQVATPFERQDSAMMTVLSRSDCLIVRPPYAPEVNPGDKVPIVELSSIGL